MSTVTVCCAACIVLGLVLTVSSLLLQLSGHMRRISGLRDENRRLREENRYLRDVEFRLKSERGSADMKLIGARKGVDREILLDRVSFIDKVLGQA